MRPEPQKNMTAAVLCLFWVATFVSTAGSWYYSPGVSDEVFSYFFYFTYVTGPTTLKAENPRHG